MLTHFNLKEEKEGKKYIFISIYVWSLRFKQNSAFPGFLRTYFKDVYPGNIYVNVCVC